MAAAIPHSRLQYRVPFTMTAPPRTSRAQPAQKAIATGTAGSRRVAGDAAERREREFSALTTDASIWATPKLRVLLMQSMIFGA